MKSKINIIASVDQYFEDGIWVCEYKPLLIVACGRTEREAREQFRIDVAHQVEFLLSTKKLTKSAKRAKKHLREILKNIYIKSEWP